MTRHNSGNRKEAIVEDRQRRVAQLVNRGLTQRQITASLPTIECLNIETGEPWDLRTINRDVKALRKDWREKAAGDTRQHQANVLAELAEVKRANWAMKPADFTVILKAIKQECDIMGLNAPVKHNIDATLRASELIPVDVSNYRKSKE